MSNVLARQLAANLRAHRIDRRLSVTELGQQLGLRRGYLGRLESGDVTVTLDQVVRLGALLGVRPLDLLDGDISRG